MKSGGFAGLAPWKRKDPSACVGTRYVLKSDDPYSSHAVLLDRIGHGYGLRLLDVGAADGSLAERFAKRGFEVTCLEGDPALAVVASAHCHSLIQADLDLEVPSLGADFDVIVYGDILEHLRDPLAVFTRINRALKPGGRIFVSVPNVAHIWVRLGMLAGRFEYADRGILDRTHLRFFTRASLLGMLRVAGVEVTDLAAVPAPLPLVLGVPCRGWVATVHRLNALAARAWGTLFAFQFVAACRPVRG